MMNPLRTGLLITLKEMGVEFEKLMERNEGGEDVADCDPELLDVRGALDALPALPLGDAGRQDIQRVA